MLKFHVQKYKSTLLNCPVVKELFLMGVRKYLGLEDKEKPLCIEICGTQLKQCQKKKKKRPRIDLSFPEVIWQPNQTVDPSLFTVKSFPCVFFLFHRRWFGLKGEAPSQEIKLWVQVQTPLFICSMAMNMSDKLFEF